MASEKTFNFIFDCTMNAVSSAGTGTAWAVNLCSTLQKHKRQICETYSLTNTFVKNAHMRDPKQPLDRHKCIACFMAALLEKLPIKENQLNKELLAISIGMLLLKVFVFQECKERKDIAFVDFVRKNKGFHFPKCSCDEEPYTHSWALGIYYDRSNAQNTNVKILSILSLSNILFLIEAYNRQRMIIETAGLCSTV